MQISFDTGTLSLGMSIASWMLLLMFIVRVSMRFGALELKVDTMWGFQMRRSMSEVVTSGVGKVNSPVVFTPEILSHLEPLKPKLIGWYKEFPNHKSDADALLGIEQSFGDDLLKLVCFPCGLSYGACLIMALVIAKESNEINLSVSEDARK